MQYTFQGPLMPMSRERSEAQENAERQQAILQSRNKELESILGALRVAMTALESRAAELSQKLGAAEVQCSSLREQLSSVQSRESILTQDFRQKDAEISQLRINLSTAEGKVGRFAAVLRLSSRSSKVLDRPRTDFAVWMGRLIERCACR